MDPSKMMSNPMLMLMCSMNNWTGEIQKISQSPFVHSSLIVSSDSHLIS